MSSLTLFAAPSPPTSPIAVDKPIKPRSFFTHSNFSVEECAKRAAALSIQTDEVSVPKREKATEIEKTTEKVKSIKIKKKNRRPDKSRGEQHQVERKIKELTTAAQDHQRDNNLAEAEKCYSQALELGGSARLYDELAVIYARKITDFLNTNPQHPNDEFCNNVSKALRCLKKVKLLQNTHQNFWIKYFSKNLYILNTLWFLSETHFDKDELRSIFNCYMENYQLIQFLMASGSPDENGKYIKYNKKFAEILIDAGFSLVKVNQQLDDVITFQHVWVHSSGLQLRIKPYRQQFTIGFVKEYPLDSQGNAVKGTDKVELITMDENELVKFTPHYIVPAHFDGKWKAWAPGTDENQRSKVMESAHFYFAYDKLLELRCAEIERISKTPIVWRYSKKYS